MLGWEVFAFRNSSTKREDMVARWMTSVFGLDWLAQLVKEGKATDLGGEGYPNRYEVSAGVLIPILSNGLPPNGSPLVIGDDCVLPEGWSGSVTWRQDPATFSASDTCFLRCGIRVEGLQFKVWRWATWRHAVLFAATKAFLGALVTLLLVVLIFQRLGPLQPWLLTGCSRYCLAFGAKEQWQLAQGTSSLLVGFLAGVGSMVGRLLSAHAWPMCWRTHALRDMTTNTNA